MLLPPGELGLSCYVLEPPVLQRWGFAEGIACCLLLLLAPPPPSSPWLQFVFPLLLPLALLQWAVQCFCSSLNDLLAAVGHHFSLYWWRIS